MSFRDSLCNSCLGCNKLELPYFQGTNYCNNAVLVKNKVTENQFKQPIKTRSVYDSINKIHKILGTTTPPESIKGEQIKIQE